MHNEELHTLYYLRTIIKMIVPRKLSRDDHVARFGV
jgi:hypothetical protein